MCLQQFFFSHSSFRIRNRSRWSPVCFRSDCFPRFGGGDLRVLFHVVPTRIRVYQSARVEPYAGVRLFIVGGGRLVPHRWTTSDSSIPPSHSSIGVTLTVDLVCRRIYVFPTDLPPRVVPVFSVWLSNCYGPRPLPR